MSAQHTNPALPNNGRLAVAPSAPLAPAATDPGPAEPNPARKKGQGMTGRNNKTLSHVQFHKAVLALTARADQFTAAGATAAQVCEVLQADLGFPVGLGTVPDLKEAAGVEWSPRRAASEKSVRGNANRTLTLALHRLLTKLGEPVPADLDALYRMYADR